MPTFPPGTNPAEITQDVIKKVYNQLVRDWFKKVDLSEDLDIRIPDHAAYAACWHLDSDSLPLTLAKQQLFSDIRNNLKPELIGETTKSSSVLRSGHPKILLYFEEDRADVETGYAPVKGRIGFRVMNKQADITESELRAIATRIKTQFNTEEKQKWRKGKVMCSYTYWEQGYQLQLLCKTVADAKSLTNKIVGIQNHAPEWERFQTCTNEAPSAAYPTVPTQAQVMGETVRLDRRRPIATVRFQYAFALIPGLNGRKPLVDRAGVFPDPLIDW